MRGNSVGLPAVPRGNSLSLRINVSYCCGQATPMSVAGFQFAFIANKDLSGKIFPPVLINWSEPPSVFYQGGVEWGQIVNDPSLAPEEYWNEFCAQNGFTAVTIPSSVTAGLEPGAYYFNIDMRDLRGNITTIMAGTWPIVAVPGMMGPYQSSSRWRPQLFDQFPPQMPRRFYAY